MEENNQNGIRNVGCNDQVIITGGANIGYSFVGYGPHVTKNQMWVLDSLTNTWTQPFPAMPTARVYPSAVGYKRWVLVVGGHREECVEVLNTESKQWYTASPLPCDDTDNPSPSLAVIQDTLYVVWELSAVSVSIPMSYHMPCPKVKPVTLLMNPGLLCGSHCQIHPPTIQPSHHSMAISSQSQWEHGALPLPPYPCTSHTLNSGCQWHSYPHHVNSVLVLFYQRLRKWWLLGDRMGIGSSSRPLIFVHCHNDWGCVVLRVFVSIFDVDNTQAATSTIHVTMTTQCCKCEVTINGVSVIHYIIQHNK